MNAVNAMLKVIDAIPNESPFIYMPSQFLDNLRLDRFFFRQVAIPFPSLLDKHFTLANVKELGIARLSFMLQNWKEYGCTSVILTFASSIISKCIAPLFANIVYAPCFQIKNHRLLSKIQPILPAAAIYGVTLAANRCLDASLLFFVGKRTTPWVALAVNNIISQLHLWTVSNLSYSQRSEPSLLNVEDVVLNLLGASKNERFYDISSTRATKLNSITYVVVSGVLLTKPFVNRNPLWVNAAVIPLMALTRQVMIRCLLSYENYKSKWRENFEKRIYAKFVVEF